jgi:GTP pyrophosphokinase
MFINKPPQLSGFMEAAYHTALYYHAGQNDKGGIPIIHHVTRVAWAAYAMSGFNEIAFCVGMLHDTLEDTAYTEQIMAERFNPTVANAVKLLTRDKDMEYGDYIARLYSSKNLIAITVKIADLLDNLNPERSETQLQRAIRDKNRGKYLKALGELSTVRAFL